MKAIGASSWQVVWGYLILVISYGVLAALISIPIGAAAALGLQNFFADFLNLEIFEIRGGYDGRHVQVAISLVAPFLAALFPLLAACGSPCAKRSAPTASTDRRALDRMVAKAVNIPYTLLLTIGNTFRNRRRVMIIELALVVAGTIFMMVMGVNDATNYTFGNKLADIHNYQVTMAFEQPERAQLVEGVAGSLQDVAAVETWLVLPGSARPAAQSESSVTDARITLFGQPAETTHYEPEIEEGRWLRPQDTNAVVVSQRVADQKEWTVGDVITLEDGNGRTLDVEIVGTLFDPATNSSVHLPLSTMQRELRYTGLANTIWVQTVGNDVGTQTAVAETLEAALEQKGISVNPSSTFGEKTIAGITEGAGEGFAIILNLLAVMAIVIALVGGVGLSGILSLSVLERRREIGVMRAIGASSWQVIRLFVGEGMLLGLISWLIALPLSIPIAYAFTTQGLSLALNQQLGLPVHASGSGFVAGDYHDAGHLRQRAAGSWGVTDQRAGEFELLVASITARSVSKR